MEVKFVVLVAWHLVICCGNINQGVPPQSVPNSFPQENDQGFQNPSYPQSFPQQLPPMQYAPQRGFPVSRWPGNFINRIRSGLTAVFATNDATATNPSAAQNPYPFYTQPTSTTSASFPPPPPTTPQQTPSSTGFFGRMKQIFGVSESEEQRKAMGTMPLPPGYGSYPSNYPHNVESGYQMQSPQQPQQPQQYQQFQQFQQYPQQQIPRPDNQSPFNSPIPGFNEASSSVASGVAQTGVVSSSAPANYYSAAAPPLGQQQLQQQQQQQQGMGQPNELTSPPTAASPPMSSANLASLIPSSPQVFVYGDSIVMVMKPRELFRKKLAVSRAGPGSWQLFGDFERVFTSFKTADGARAIGSTEALESPQSLPPQTLAALRSLAEEFSGLELEQEPVMEEYIRKCHEVIARSGSLHLSSLPSIVRSQSNRMGLRVGAIQMLQTLSTKKIPTFLFSSGYGDIVAHMLLQAGCGEKNTGHLPQNIRIISNFCRAGPDGTVRAFSQPIIHERNKNVSTASRFMGFPVGGTPFAVVLGSQEEDVQMTEGMEGLQDQINVGYMDIGEDFLQRLPAFLTSYDAVILGDGSFQYLRSIINELLQIPNEGDGTSRLMRPVMSLFERSIGDFF